jgi:tetratricopeptide (TPR) repeat protein
MLAPKTHAVSSWIGVVGLLFATAAAASDDPVYGEAIKAFETGDFRSAAHGLEQLVDRNPNWTAGLVSLGQSYLMLGEMDDAERHMAHAKAVDPAVDLYRAYWVPGNLLYRDRRYDSAVAALDLALKNAPDAHRQETSLRLSHAMLLNGDYGAARSRLANHLAEFGSTYKATYYLGLACRKDGDMDCALENLREARRIDPQQAATFEENLAKWSRSGALRVEDGHRRTKLLEGALDDARRWCENQPENATAQEYYANNLLSLGRVEQLVEEFRGIAEANTRNCAAPLFVARGYNHQRDGARAAEWARTAASCDPQSAGAHVELAAALVHQLSTSYDSIEQVQGAREMILEARSAARRSMDLSAEDNRLAEQILSESDATIEHLERVERELVTADKARQEQVQATIRERCKILWWKSRTEGQDLTEEESRFFLEHECLRIARTHADGAVR